MNGGVRFDLVFSFFSSFMYPDLWKFDKNEKFNPIQWQPGPKVSMTFHGLVLGLVGLIDAKDIDVAQPIWS